VRIVVPEAAGGRDTAVPHDAGLPVTEVCRTGRAFVHTSQAQVAREFPRLHPRMVGAGLQSLAHIPATYVGRTTAVLCFGWTDSTQAERHRWLLTVLADLVGEAVARLGSPRAAAPDGGQDRRKSQARGLTVGRVEVDIAARTAHVRGRPAVVLTGREFALLLQLMRSTGTVQSRPELLAQVWGPSRTDTAVVDVTMSRLRRKLDLPELVTVPNLGYMFDPDQADDFDESVREPVRW
jgi:DNA-binding winged helix-turn-helix (wHTH) protein